MQNNRTRFVIVLGGILLITILYFLPQKVEKKMVVENQTGFSMDEQITAGKARLKRQEKDQVIVIEDLLKKSPDSKVYLDSLGKLWDRF